MQLGMKKGHQKILAGTGAGLDCAVVAALPWHAKARQRDGGCHRSPKKKPELSFGVMKTALNLALAGSQV